MIDFPKATGLMIVLGVVIGSTLVFGNRYIVPQAIHHPDTESDEDLRTVDPNKFGREAAAHDLTAAANPYVDETDRVRWLAGYLEERTRWQREHGRGAAPIGTIAP